MARRDYYHDGQAPTPNRIVPAVSAVVIDPAGRLLLHQRVDNGRWALPGGVLEIGETPAGAAVRETREETGICVTVDGLVGVYSDPGHIVAYDDGEIRQAFSITFRATISGGQVSPQSNEVRQVDWIDPADLPGLDIHPAQRRRIRDGLAWTPGLPARYDPTEVA